jgi:DNA-binding PadR family transcriptional regulator
MGRLSRGDIRALLISALLDGPAHGYELMRRLEEASGGAWSPSPGSVYPTLQMLEEEGLLDSSMESGRKTYSLTANGEAFARTATAVRKPWEDGGLPPGRYELRDITHAVHIAAKQVGTEGTPEQVERAIELMRSTRRQLYRMLAED